jgi:hypothetical protein
MALTLIIALKKKQALISKHILFALQLYPAITHAEESSFFAGLGCGTLKAESSTTSDLALAANQYLKDQSTSCSCLSRL